MELYQVLERNAKDDRIESIAVGAIIPNQKGEILLVKRRKDNFMGQYYELPSGKVRKEEGIYEALIRSIKQVTNLSVEKVLAYVDQFDYLSGACKKCRQFNFEVKTNSEERILLTEHEAAKWIKVEDISKEEISPEVKRGLLIYAYNNFQKNN